MYIHICIYLERDAYIYIYIERERERKREMYIMCMYVYVSYQDVLYRYPGAEVLVTISMFAAEERFSISGVLSRPAVDSEPRSQGIWSIRKGTVVEGAVKS